MPCAYWRFYEGDEPRSEIEDVEEVILDGGLDHDGISRSMWLTELASQDLPMELMTIILKDKKNPAFKELYQCIRDEIGGFMDKESR